MMERVADYKSLGLPQAASGEPAAHENAYIRLAGRFAGSSRLVDRPRPQQARPLLQRSRAEDGYLRRFCQRAIGARHDQHSTEAVQRQDQPQG